MSKPKSTQTRLKAIKKKATKIRKSPRTKKAVKKVKRTAKSAIERMMLAAERHHGMATTIPKTRKKSKRKRK